MLRWITAFVRVNQSNGASGMNGIRCEFKAVVTYYGLGMLLCAKQQPQHVK